LSNSVTILALFSFVNSANMGRKGRPLRKECFSFLFHIVNRKEAAV
jgi:hypothetical protein